MRSVGVVPFGVWGLAQSRCGGGWIRVWLMCHLLVFEMRIHCHLRSLRRRVRGQLHRHSDGMHYCRDLAAY